MKIASGKDRKPYRIKEWLAGRKIKVIGVAAALGIHHGLVSDTIHGRRNNRRVLRWMLEHGCPRDVLGLPEDMREAA